MEELNRKEGSVYRVKVYINGRPVSKTFKRKTDALKWKQNQTAERDRTISMGGQCAPDISVSDYIEIWRTNKANLSRRSVDSYDAITNRYIIPMFGYLKLKDIKVAHGHLLIVRTKKDSLSESRINDCLRFFKQLLNDAVKWDYLQVNPLRKIDKLKELPRQPTYWLPAEVQRFLNSSAGDEFFPLYLIALNTGLRRSELMGMLWDKIDYTNGLIEISRTRDRYGLKETTKTGKIRYVPMNQVVVDCLKNLKEKAQNLNYVFLKRDGSIPAIEHISDRDFQRAVTKADSLSRPAHNVCF